MAVAVLTLALEVTVAQEWVTLYPTIPEPPYFQAAVTVRIFNDSITIKTGTDPDPTNHTLRLTWANNLTQYPMPQPLIDNACLAVMGAVTSSTLPFNEGNVSDINLAVDALITQFSSTNGNWGGSLSNYNPMQIRTLSPTVSVS